MISYPPHTSSSTPRPSPRQLQGPRPTPLKVRKDSYKINKKAPTAAAVPPNNPNPPPALANLHEPPRPPVIIYTVSPKIIHTKPSEFMSLVQRLTGPDSPSARFAAIQTAHKFSSSSSSPRPQQQQQQLHVEEDGDGSSSVVLMVDRGASASASTGILSPMPSSLPPISSSFFSPMSFDAAGTFGFLQDLSPGPNAGFLISPTITVPSPGAAWDHIFNHF